MTVWETPHGRDFVKKAIQNGAACVIPEYLRDSFAKAVENSGEMMTVSESRDLAGAFAGDPGDIALGFPRRGEIVFLKEGRMGRRVFDACLNSGRRWRLVWLANPGSVVPESVKTLVWWGVSGESDCLYAIEEEISKRQIDPAAIPWHTGVCGALCRMEPELVGRVIDNAPASPEAAAAFLFSHPLFTKENGALARKFLESGARAGSLPPEENPGLALWQRGCLDRDTFGFILHPAALLAAGMTREVKAVIAAGIERAFLPLVGKAHAAVCRRMERDYGPNWHERRIAGKFEDNAHRREISPLNQFLRLQYKDEAALAAFAGLWSDIRHCVAHGDFLPWELALKGSLALREME